MEDYHARKILELAIGLVNPDYQVANKNLEMRFKSVAEKQAYLWSQGERGADIADATYSAVSILRGISDEPFFKI